MKRIVILVLGLIILQGCLGLQLSSTKTEAIVDKTSANAISVTFCGNAYMTQKEVEKYALQRASSETLLKGYHYFVIMNKEDKSKMCSLNSGMDKKHRYDSLPIRNSGLLTQSDFVEPNVTLIIRGIPKGEKIPENAIDAEKFLDENFPGINK